MPTASDSTNAQAWENGSASSKGIPEEQEEVDSSVQPPIHESFLVKGNKALHEKMGVIKEFLTILIFLAILIGFLYNHFSMDERDLPDSFCHNLYKLLSSAAGVPISLETGMIQIGNGTKFFTRYTLQRTR